MSDDLTDRIDAHRARPGIYAEGADALLAEARDEITRLREGIERAIDAYDPYGDHQIDAARALLVRALLDAPSTGEVEHG